jgi:hypothetical protein
MVTRFGEIFADDPATTHAHALLAEFDLLPDSAGVISPEQMLARALVLAVIGVSNQLARLPSELDDTIAEAVGRGLDQGLTDVETEQLP